MKERNKYDFIKMKNFSSSKDTVKIKKISRGRKSLQNTTLMRDSTQNM